MSASQLTSTAASGLGRLRRPLLSAPQPEEVQLIWHPIWSIWNCERKKEKKKKVHYAYNHKKKKNRISLMPFSVSIFFPFHVDSFPIPTTSSIIYCICYVIDIIDIHIWPIENIILFSRFILTNMKKITKYTHSIRGRWFDSICFFFLRVRFVQVVIFHELPASVIVSSERPASSIKDERMRQSGAVASPSLNPNVFHRLSLAIEASSVARVVY